ncbi:toxic anion resistance protein [Bacillus sp. NSP9.1]|uniref:toxic anion resistance protein n=1 Tax=Bacillus sp. NSP9.1 TaxID=1071078 RepID=UPI0004143EC6|nr:toxic anion resistance protein [Bacillus sp. NSP9.1]QHZ44861.1 toxic anion resistance protein [Bacillus sp. NSP9.1]
MTESNPSQRKVVAGRDLLVDPYGQGADVLSEKNRRRALQLAEQIDPKNHQSITQFGAQTQLKLADFSHAFLEHVQKNDAGETGNVLGELVKKLKQVSPDELQPKKRSFFSRFFGGGSHSVQEVLSRYQKTAVQIDRISVRLEYSRTALIGDHKMLDQLYEKNREYYEALNIYIAAGRLKLEELHTKIIPKLKEELKTERHHMAAHDINDMIQFADRLEKRLYDLTVSRQITLQSAAQIRLIQHTNQVLAEKIQSSIITAIPLWKNQVAIALALLRQHRAAETQKQVSDTTNELLIKNAEMLKANSVEIAKEKERGFVDIETLKKVQDNLIGIIEETLNIQEEGQAKRLKAEEKIRQLEGDFKMKLMNMKDDR